MIWHLAQMALWMALTLLAAAVLGAVWMVVDSLLALSRWHAVNPPAAAGPKSNRKKVA